MNIRIRQIYYKPVQYGLCDEKFFPYENKKASLFLENQVIADLFNQKDYLDCDYYGIFSWKFRNKISYTSSYIFNRMEQLANENFEVFSFFDANEQRNPNLNMWKQGNVWHPLFSTIGKLLFQELGLPDPLTIRTRLIFSNHWITTPKIYARFCKEMLIPCMELMQNNQEIKELCEMDANYISRDRLKEEDCFPIFGKYYYTYHPFICERLFGTFCGLHDIKLKHI